MKRIAGFFGITMVALALGCGSGTKSSESAAVTTAAPQTMEAAAETTTDPAVNGTETAESTAAAAFTYEHNPKDNAAVMKDVIENPDAVYGFSPNPESTHLAEYAEYDWTDPEFVEKAKKERIEYHESMKSLSDMLSRMKADGASTEETARAVSAERNRIRLESCKDDPEGLKKLKQSNKDTYGHEEGPTPEELYEKYGSWEVVLQKAFSVNMGMDACCGLYDEYYDQFAELGLVKN